MAADVATQEEWESSPETTDGNECRVDSQGRRFGWLFQDFKGENRRGRLSSIRRRLAGVALGVTCDDGSLATDGGLALSEATHQQRHQQRQGRRLHGLCQGVEIVSARHACQEDGHLLNAAS